MSKIKTAVGLAGACAAATAAAVTGVVVLGVAPAHADHTGVSAFLSDVHSMGLVGSGGNDDSDIVAGGYLICNAARAGNSVPVIQARVESHLASKGVSASEADRLVTYAISDLCPDAG
jgi:hypothetical protein